MPTTNFTHIVIQLVLCAINLARVEEDFFGGVYISASHPHHLKAKQIEKYNKKCELGESSLCRPNFSVKQNWNSNQEPQLPNYFHFSFLLLPLKSKRLRISLIFLISPHVFLGSQGKKDKSMTNHNPPLPRPQPSNQPKSRKKTPKPKCSPPSEVANKQTTNKQMKCVIQGKGKR